MQAHAPTSSASVATSPPCMIPGGPWCCSVGVMLVTISSPSRVKPRRKPNGWSGAHPKQGCPAPKMLPSRRSLMAQEDRRAAALGQLRIRRRRPVARGSVQRALLEREGEADQLRLAEPRTGEGRIDRRERRRRESGEHRRELEDAPRNRNPRVAAL